MLIVGYTKHNQVHEALLPSTLLKACGSSRDIEKGNKICNVHSNSGLVCTLPLATLILIPMEDIFYGKTKILNLS